MVHVTTPKPSLGASLGNLVGGVGGIYAGNKMAEQKKEAEDLRQSSKLREALANAQQIYSNPNLPTEQKRMGLMQALASHPEMAKQVIGQFEQQQQMDQQNKALRAIERQRGLPEGSLSGLEGQPAVAASLTKPQNAAGGVTSQPVPPEVTKSMKTIIENFPNANADELKLKLDEAQVPPIFSTPLIENRRRQDESKAANLEGKQSENRRQTAPLKQEIIERANRSRESIQSKSHLINLIDKGDLNDPTYATFLETLPFNLGKRLLSNDTVEYKSGLVDEFSDLKNIFKGATRVKEVEIYENKLADLYLTDSQKKAILISRIDAAKADIIREEAAQEIEEKYPDISALQFNKKVADLSKEKMDNLFNNVWEQQKSILDQAEKRKKIPLDVNDPEDYKIMNQIFLEANGDPKKALELAKKKGYKLQE